MTKQEIAMWVLLGLIAIGTAFNNFLLHHIEDQIDELQESTDR